MAVVQGTEGGGDGAVVEADQNERPTGEGRPGVANLLVDGGTRLVDHIRQVVVVLDVHRNGHHLAHGAKHRVPVLQSARLVTRRRSIGNDDKDGLSRQLLRLKVTQSIEERVVEVRLVGLVLRRLRLVVKPIY